MALSNMLQQLRNHANLSQEKFAELLHVSQQSVQKWESGATTPDLEKLVRIAKHFDVSLDALVLESDERLREELQYNKTIQPKYANIHLWETYFDMNAEYDQCYSEGLDIEPYKNLFQAVASLPRDDRNDPYKKRIGDVLFDIVNQLPMREGYPYVEPSDLEEIKALREPYAVEGKVPDRATLEKKIRGAWIGRACGCLLGKTVEGIRLNELIPFLKETGNYPMHRYILHSDLNDDILNKYKFRFAARCYADKVDGMPSDDDMNYVIMGQEIINRYGKSFSPFAVSRTWLNTQVKDAYCTAERVAFCNFINGIEPPQSAVYKNPYREFIGAQIRGDYFGYISPGKPEEAADMAFRDASISHVKNGIYGEMFVAAMLAVAATTDNIEDIIRGGLAQIPATSRLYEEIIRILNWHAEGVSRADCLKHVCEAYGENTPLGWCHTISNAMIVVISLLYCDGDYAKGICMSVESGYDTDCNGATVGSILGMIGGIDSIPDEWSVPIGDKLYSNIFGKSTVSFTACVEDTMKHIDL